MNNLTENKEIVKPDTYGREKNTRLYIERLHNYQIKRNFVSDLHKKIYLMHYEQIKTGIQHISFLSTYEIARRLGISDFKVKKVMMNLREDGFLIISDILTNHGRPNYGYGIQIKDPDREYYYEDFHPKTFRKKVYISRVNKGGIIERNCLVEEKETRKLRLAGKQFKALGIPISNKEGKEQVTNPDFEFNLSDENSDEIKLQNDIYEEFYLGNTLQDFKSIGSVVSSSVRNDDVFLSNTSKQSVFKLPSENVFYKRLESSQDSILNRLKSQVLVDWSKKSVDEHGEIVREVYEYKSHGVSGYAVVPEWWSGEIKEQQARINWGYQMAWHMIQSLDWTNFAKDNPTEAVIYWLESHGMKVQKLKHGTKEPIYDKYFPSDAQLDEGLEKTSIWRKVRNIIEKNNSEFGINLSHSKVVCLDFDADDRFFEFMELFPVLWNSLVLKTDRGYHLYLYLTAGLKKFLSNKKSLFGIELDAKVNGFARFSNFEIVNSAKPLIMPYEIYCEWAKQVPVKSVENPVRKMAKNFFSKLRYVQNKTYPVGYRRVESWKDLRGLRHGLSYDEYLEIAAEMYKSFDQSDSDYYTITQHNSEVRRAWNKRNLNGEI